MNHEGEGGGHSEAFFKNYSMILSYVPISGQVLVHNLPVYCIQDVRGEKHAVSKF